MNSTDRADVVVVGMGVGGEAVAGELAEAGLDVVGIEAELVGGECPYWGCIPSKMMIRAANLLAEARRVPGMAGELVGTDPAGRDLDRSVKPDWGLVAKRIRDEATDDWNDKVAVERFEGKGGRFIRGGGRLLAPGRVAVGDREIEARRAIVVATGTSAAIPPIPGLHDVRYWTNRDAMKAEQPPRSMVVLGGGAIGAELAQAFARFGTEVTVVEAQDQMLPTEEPEAGQLLAEVFEAEGIQVRTGVQATSVRQEGRTITLELEPSDEGGSVNLERGPSGPPARDTELEGGQVVSGETLLVSTGRKADLGMVGLGAVGVDESQRWVPVDDHLRVTEGVWAVGDITGKGAFTHVAAYQAPIVVASILGQDHAPADYAALPRVTFTDPEVGGVGLTESQAREAGLNVRTGIQQVPHSARGWIHKAGNDGVIKLVEDADRGVLVGATAMGPNGGEVLGMLTLAVHAEVPVDQLRTMIYAYPTFHRGVEDALRDLA